MIDWDCDGYGPGSPLGPDADDNDPTVNTGASFIAKYGTLAAGLSHLGYNPLRIWQVSLSGNDSSCNTNGTACATFQTGVYPHLQAGDAVLYRAGTYIMPAYSLNLSISGTASNPIIIMAYPGESVTLDWTASNADGPNISNQSYITFDGLHLNGGSNGMGFTEIGYGATYNVTLRNMQITGFYDSVWMTPLNNFLYERNVFGPASLGGEHNMYLMGNPTPSSNLIIRNNLIFSNGAGGGHNIHLNGRFPNALVQGNIMYNAQNNCLGLQTGVNHSTFENNLCFTTANSAITLIDYYQNSNTDIIAHDQNYNTFRNNTISFTGTNYTDGSTSCTQYLVWVSDTSGGSGSFSNPTNASHDLGHNTYDNNVMVSACPGGSAAAIRYDTDNNGTGGMQWLATDTWRNNIIYSANPYQWNFLTVGNNSWTSFTNYSFAQFEAGLAAGRGTNLQSNPLLVAASQAWYNAPQNFNFQVQAGSPAIGAGLASDAPAVDIMGRSRGAAPDIGAYQYGGSTPVSNQIALSINTTVLNGGTVGVAYSQGLSASGGTSPYSWALISGSLPSGLALSSSGLISGTPTAAGTSSFTVQVQDSVGHNGAAAWNITIAAPAATAALSSVSCVPGSLSSNGSATCSVALSAAAPAGGASVALASNSALVAVPSSVTVSAGAASAAFTATSGTITASSTAVITATLSSACATASVALQPSSSNIQPVTTSSAAFTLLGTAAELGGTANGATVTPTSGPAGQLTVRGTGSVNFSGAGVSFKTGGEQNTNTAFYNFKGSQLQNVFNVSQGQISFNLTSSYSFAARQQLPQYNYRIVFDTFDNSQELFVFQVEAVYGNLMFYYNTGGTTGQMYYVTPGQEDTLFGAGVTMQTKLAWDGKNVYLYLNGTLVSTQPYSPATPNWTSASSFTLGASDVHNYSGGFYSCDDVVSGFQIQNPSGTSPAPALPTVSAVQCIPASLASGAASACTVTLSAASASAVAVALSSSSALLTVPASVTVAAGASSAGFTATAGQIGSNQSAGVTAALNGSSQSASIALTAPLPTISAVQCSPASLASGAAGTCTITLSAAPAAAAAVTLSSSSAVLTVPASATVAAGASSTSFTATAGQISSNQSAGVTAALNGSSQSASIALTAPVPTISAVQCSPASLASGAAGTCTITLSAAPAAAAAVTLSSSSAVLTVPASVTVAAGATSATFKATAGQIASSQSATVTATLNHSSQSASIALTAAVSAIRCSQASLASGAATACTVTLSAAAPTHGSAVALSSNSTLLTVPSSVTVTAGAASAAFTATAGTITTSSTAVITATLSSACVTASVALQAPALSGTSPVTTSSAAFSLLGTAAELSGTANGATVTPTAGPAGQLTVRGTGSVNFSGAGVSFKTGGEQNTNTAFYNFKGSQLQNVFNVSQGQISFNLTSSYSFAARQQLPLYNYRIVFDTYDNSQELFVFQVEAVYGNLMFYYNTGGKTGQMYYVTPGQENTLFGAGVTMQTKLAWDGKNVYLYLNGTLVSTQPYSPATPNWTSTSSFTLGASDVHNYSGGFYSCDDVVSGFQVKTTTN